MKIVDIYFDDRDKHNFADTLIYQNENLATDFTMHLPSSWQGYSYKLAIKLNTGLVTEVTLTETDGVLVYSLIDTYTSDSGYLYIQLHIYEVSGEMVGRSSIMPFAIKPSLELPQT